MLQLYNQNIIFRRYYNTIRLLRCWCQWWCWSWWCGDSVDGSGAFDNDDRFNRHV